MLFLLFLVLLVTTFITHHHVETYLSYQKVNTAARMGTLISVLFCFVWMRGSGMNVDDPHQLSSKMNIFRINGLKRQNSNLARNS